MEFKDAILIVKDIIRNNLKHEFYDRTVKKAKEYKTIITGEGISEYMKKFPKRETQEEFEQRQSLTVNITSTVCGNLIDPQKKLTRSNSIEKTFLYTDKQQKKHTEFQGIINSFYQGRKSIDNYMAKNWIELNNLDPNSLIVVDWKANKNGERIKPYPVEYPAEKVYNYQKVNGELEWVCVHREDKTFEPEMYILYTRNFTVLFSRKKIIDTHVVDADIEFYTKFDKKNFQGGVVAAMKADSDDTFWEITIPTPHNLGEVPAIFVGFVTDLFTRESFLSPIDKAMPILKKVIKADAELDYTMLIHAFPQKAQYTNPCPECKGNRTTRDGTTCETCGGSGEDQKDIQHSALDIIKVPRPRDKEDMFPLSDLIHYAKQPVDLLTFQDKYVDKLVRRCKEAVYNSEVFTKTSVAETATSKNIDLQNVYDALWDMAVAYADAQNYIVKLVSKITELDKNLVYKLSFRKDFKMKSLTDLYMDLKTVGDSNADEFVKKSIEDDIAQILYEGDSRMLNKYETMNYFFPFNGKNKKEIEVIVTNPNMINEETKILWANFAWIFDEIEIDFADKDIDFYMLERKKQKEAIDNKIQEIIKTIDKPETYVGEAVSRFGQEAEEAEETTD